MTTSVTWSSRGTGWRRTRRSTVMLVILFLAGMAVSSSGCAGGSIAGPREFWSPDEAVGALASAIRANDTVELLAIMGSEGQQIVSSGDEVADQNRRLTFLSLFDEAHALVNEEADVQTLVVGRSDWPFPVPLVREGRGWVFDARAGREEILNRRIGENELSAIEVCKAIADAQQEYAIRDPDGDGVREYARKFPSDAGTRNGLYWPTGEGEVPSPLGDLAAHAAQQGYSRRSEGRTPYHGYYYRILERQGAHAPDGTLEYVVNGKMILGFAVTAYPAEYGGTGVMTFIMGPDCVVYQKDLGEETVKLASEMESFDPSAGWARTDEIARPPAPRALRSAAAGSNP
jgi:hypothetical protein